MANFNIPPYFDDYDPDKGYHKILFRPSVAVQARELNQMQSILQKQIERFGSHIFKEGTIVLGGAFDLEQNVNYVKASGITFPNLTLDSFIGKVFVGETSGVKGYIKAIEYDADESVYAIMLRYTASGVSEEYLPSETVVCETDSTLTFTVNSSSPTGIGSTFGIDSGVIFSKGYFIFFPKDTIIIDKYTVTPTATIGLLTEESFVTDLNDDSLLDNALGSPNENAPGAHRYKISVGLVSLAYGEGYDNPNFIPLMDINNGVVETRNERTQYSRIYDELAKRTYDESGDYYVRGFDVRTREHLDNGTNEGLYTLENGGDSTKLSVDIEPGVAYVKGYEINKLITQHVVIDKAIDYDYVNNHKVNTRSGGYVQIKEIVGSLQHDEGIVVDLYDTAETRITDNIKNTVSPTGNKIGEAKLKSLVYESGTLGTPSGIMRMYLFDFNMNAGKTISNVRSVYKDTAPDKFFADVILTNGIAVVEENTLNTLIFPINSENTKTIRSNTGYCDTSFQFNRTETFSANLNAISDVSVSVSTVDETLAYTEGSLSTAEKRELIFSINSDADIALPGSITGTNGTYEFTGTSTEFDLLSAGNRIEVNGYEYYINTIVSNTSLTLTSTVQDGTSNNNFVKALRAGDIIDLTSKGSTGESRDVQISGGNLVIDLKENTSTPSSVNTRITYRVNRDTALEKKKRLRSNVFVNIDTSNNVANSVGPYNLGFSDIYKIRSIRISNSAFTAVTDGSNVTSSFTLDNGQRDNFYDHGKIIHTGSLDLDSKYLLAELDYFEQDDSQGYGYFSVDSYPVNDSVTSNTSIFTYEIPTYTSTFGIKYNLKDVLDYRPVKNKTANISYSYATSTTNPPTTDSFSVGTDGLRMVSLDSEVSMDYSYYLPRRDLITIDKYGNFDVIKGESSLTPTTPRGNDNSMDLAKVFIPPYPSISETLARQINKREIGCATKKLANPRYTMRQIGTIKNRVDNLDYYNAINLLERSALDYSIVDENGLDRFKNGFFVDGFLDHSLGDNGNPDYNISVDKVEQIIRPVFILDAFQYRLEEENSYGYQQTGNLITRPYTETILSENKNVTSTRNIEQSVFRFIGTIDMNPDIDNWTDSTLVDKILEYGNDIPVENTITTEYGSWETKFLGYNVYDRRYGDRSGRLDPRYFIGTYSTYAEAVAAGNRYDPARSGGIRYLIQGVYSSERKVKTTSVSYENSFEEIGEFVTDVSLKSYIRPQTIKMHVKGLKPNTRFYLYFDSENMSEYVTVADFGENNIPSWFKYTDQVLYYNAKFFDPTITLPDKINYLDEGDPIYSNDAGEIAIKLRLPLEGKRFRVGSKEVMITDSPTNSVDASSYATNYFVAQGLNVAKQNTIISTKIPIINETENIQKIKKNGGVTVVGPSCMAYSFKVDVPTGEDGVFLTSTDIWVNAKHASLGVWFEIREMDNAGGVTRNQVPYSEVWLSNEEINLWDGSAATEETGKTNVKFPSPVFLFNDTQYAFIIHTEGLNPDYYFWISRLGETDIISGNQVTSRKLTGTVYTTNNNLNYDIVPDIDLKVRFNRAKFEIGTGEVIIGNRETEFVNLSNTDVTDGTVFNNSGEIIKTSEILSLSSITSGANNVIVGDKVVGATSGVTANVISISNGKYYTDGFDFEDDEIYTILDSSDIDKSITGDINLVEYGIGNLRKHHYANNYMIIDNTNGLFFSNSKLKGVVSNETATLSSFDEFKYSTTTLKPYYLKFSNTEISFAKRGWYSNASANSFTSYLPGSSDSYSDFPAECTILSRVTELSKYGESGENSSSQVKTVLTNYNEYTSPVFDISRSQSVYVYNILNDDITGEDGASGGNLINTYISRPVTLADGQDAEDLLVTLSAYKLAESDVKVWAKFKNDEDVQLLKDNLWLPMEYNSNVYSSDTQSESYRDLTYTIPNLYRNGNGVIQYIRNTTDIVANTTGIDRFANSILIANADTIFSANQQVFYKVPEGGTPITPLSANTYYFVDTVNSTAITLKSTTSGSQIDITDFRTDAVPEAHTIGGEVYTGFKNFTVKVGLLGTNSAKPPKVGDLRVIALQV